MTVLISSSFICIISYNINTRIYSRLNRVYHSGDISRGWVFKSYWEVQSRSYLSMKLIFTTPGSDGKIGIHISYMLYKLGMEELVCYGQRIFFDDINCYFSRILYPRYKIWLLSWSRILQSLPSSDRSWLPGIKSHNNLDFIFHLLLYLT